METGRDDFVIAIRSAFLKKSNKQRFSLFFLIFLSLIFLILGKYNFTLIDYLKISLKELVYRSSFIVSIPENYAKKSMSKIEDHWIIYDDYQKIKEENKKIKADNLQFNYLESENQRLKEIIDEYSTSTEAIIAKVLIDKKSPFLRSIVINKGSKENIKLGMAVLDGDFLIGKTVEVNYLTSRVLLLSDLNSKIPVIVEPGGVLSILSGTGKSGGNLQYSEREIKFNDGDKVYSSDAGGIFKSGIPIGEVIIKKDVDLTDGPNVIFFSDFSQLKFVNVKTFKNLGISNEWILQVKFY